MRYQELLQFSRSDLETFILDQLLKAIDDIDVTILIDVANVTFTVRKRIF